MLYVFMALYAEAAPFIAQMKLKRVNDSGKFVLYQDEAGEAILAVTGPGKVEAARSPPRRWISGACWRRCA